MVLKKNKENSMFSFFYGLNGCDLLMDEYKRGVVVKLHLTRNQEVQFKKNYGCDRKVHNELLSKCKIKYGDDLTIIPTQNELNDFFIELKKNYHICAKQSPLVFNRHVMIYIKRLKIVLKAKDIILQNSTLKRKHDLDSDKPLRKEKKTSKKKTTH